MSEPAAVAFRAFVSPEDRARADFYALLSRLFAAAPDAALLSAIAAAPPLETEDVGAPLAMAWSNLIAVASVVDEDAMHEEFERLFVGVGKAPLNLHASHHLTGFMMEQPLSDVRTALTELGLIRQATTAQVEDHFAALLETMRVLIAGLPDVDAKSINVQSKFFQAHLAPWFVGCCDQIMKSPLANLYIPVAQLAKNFLQLEQEQFVLNFETN